MTRLTFDEQPLEAEIVARNPLRVVIEGQEHVVTGTLCPPAGAFNLTLDGQIYRGWCYTGEREIYVRLNGRTHLISLASVSSGRGGEGAAANEIRSDMPGTVVALHVAEGETVTAGQKLLTIESMKLQIAVPAPRDGIVAKIHAAANTTFDRGAVLITLAPRKD